jgi:hypothetical protein
MHASVACLQAVLRNVRTQHVSGWRSASCWPAAMCGFFQTVQARAGYRRSYGAELGA